MTTIAAETTADNNVKTIVLKGRVSRFASDGTSPAIVDSWHGGVDISKFIVQESATEDDAGGITTVTTLSLLPSDIEGIWVVDGNLVQILRLENKYGVYYRAYPYRYRQNNGIVKQKTFLAADCFIGKKPSEREYVCPRCGEKAMGVNTHTNLYYCASCKGYGDAYDLYLAVYPDGSIEDFFTRLCHYPTREEQYEDR